MQSALGQRQIDRSAALEALDALIVALLQQLHVPASAGQQQRQQGAGEACAGNQDVP